MPHGRQVSQLLALHFFNRKTPKTSFVLRGRGCAGKAETPGEAFCLWVSSPALVWVAASGASAQT